MGGGDYLYRCWCDCDFQRPTISFASLLSTTADGVVTEAAVSRGSSFATKGGSVTTATATGADEELLLFRVQANDA